MARRGAMDATYEWGPDLGMSRGLRVRYWIRLAKDWRDDTGGFHVMHMNLKRPLTVGETVPLKLAVEGADKELLTTDVTGGVRTPDAPNRAAQRVASHARPRRRRAEAHLWAAFFAASLSAPSVNSAEFAYYPGSWLDSSQGALGRGAVYVSQDRIERVHSFYRQFLFELPSGGGAVRFCLDAVDRPDACRRFVELRDLSAAGVGTRISVYRLP